MQRMEFNNIYAVRDAIKRLAEPKATELINQILTDPSIRTKLIGNTSQFAAALNELPLYAKKICHFIISDKQIFQQLMQNQFQLLHCIEELSHDFLLDIIKATPANIIAETLCNLMMREPKSILLFLKCGINPTLINKNDKNLLEMILSKQTLNEDDIDVALALIQNDLDPQSKNDKGQDILQILYAKNNQIRTYLLNEGIPEKNIDNTDFVFKNINIASLRIQLKYLSTTYVTKSHFLMFLYLLSIDKANTSSVSLFKQLPLELVVYIIKFMDISLMEKSLDEVMAATVFIMDNPDQIKKLASTPGGINLFQNKNKSHPSFFFFKSAKLLSHEFHQVHRDVENVVSNPILHKKKGEWLENSLFYLNELRNEHALSTYTSHMLTLKSDAERLDLQEAIKDTEIYHPLASKL